MCANVIYPRLGIIGGGQLGRMISLSAAKFGCDVVILADNSMSPASKVSLKTIISDFHDESVISEFVSSVDAAVVEFENIPAEFLRKISGSMDVYPSANVLRIAQNRLLEKEFAQKIGGISVVPFRRIFTFAELKAEFLNFGCVALILKTAELGYDGNGQYPIFTEEDIEPLELIDWGREYVLEVMLELKMEVSIVGARGSDGSIEFFPIAENVHRNGILITSSVPANIGETSKKCIMDFSRNLMEEMEIIGLLAVEFFITNDGEVFFNEMAPRPHNSCHWSLSACNVSQFDQISRIAIGLPPKKIELIHPCRTENLLGQSVLRWKEYAATHDVNIYGKDSIKDRRKMGHVNVMGSK